MGGVGGGKVGEERVTMADSKVEGVAHVRQWGGGVGFAAAGRGVGWVQVGRAEDVHSGEREGVMGGGGGHDERSRGGAHGRRGGEFTVAGRDIDGVVHGRRRYSCSGGRRFSVQSC